MWEQLLGQADEVKASSTDAFLSDLAACEDAQQEDVVAVAWTSEQTLSDLAGDVVRAYRASGSMELLTSGYLDLKGHAWGAVLLDEEGWVDVAVVASLEDAETSQARIARLWPRDS